ncbi:MAG: cytochrome c [Rubrivivax sp.]|nr:cytochrome c [Rubrivivax sp.]
MKRLALTAAATLLALTTALPAAAQFQRPDDAIKYRKGAFFVMGQHFGRIGAMAQGRVPFDAAAAAVNAEIVQTLSRLPFTAFGDGTDKGDTRALPKIWSERAQFDAGAKKMQDEVANLVVAAKSNDLEKLKAAFGAAGQTCKACHDNFRKE